MDVTKLDPNAITEEYVAAATSDRRAHAGRSYGWELALATVLAVAFVGWAAWAFLF
jgi:hypothetical protein